MLHPLPDCETSVLTLSPVLPLVCLPASVQLSSSTKYPAIVSHLFWRDWLDHRSCGFPCCEFIVDPEIQAQCSRLTKKSVNFTELSSLLSLLLKPSDRWKTHDIQHLVSGPLCYLALWMHLSSSLPALGVFLIVLITYSLYLLLLYPLSFQCASVHVWLVLFCAMKRLKALWTVAMTALFISFMPWTDDPMPGIPACWLLLDLLLGPCHHLYLLFVFVLINMFQEISNILAHIFPLLHLCWHPWPHLCLQLPSSLLLLSLCRLGIVKILFSGLFMDPLQAGSCFFFYAEAKMLAVSSWSLQVWPFLTWIDCWRWPWPCCSWNCVPSVLQQFYGGGNSSRGFSLWLSAYYYRGYTFICLHAGMTAPGIFLFLQTKLLVFLLSIYFRDLFISPPLKALCSGMLFLLSLFIPVSIVTDAISTLPVTQCCNLCPGHLPGQWMHSSYSE